MMQLLPMLGMGGSVVFFFMTPNPIMRIMGIIMIASTVAMAVAMMVRFRRGTQGQLADMRRDYLKYLTQTRRAVLRTARKQRDAQFYLHPSPDQLWALVAEEAGSGSAASVTPTSRRCVSGWAVRSSPPRSSRPRPHRSMSWSR